MNFKILGINIDLFTFIICKNIPNIINTKYLIVHIISGVYKRGLGVQNHPEMYDWYEH